MITDHTQTKIEQLGKPKITSPIKNELFTNDNKKILANVDKNKIVAMVKDGIEPPAFESAGAREYNYFDPKESTAAIVTCGGLCPGINNVIRSLVMQLYHTYGVKEIWGIRYGYEGFNPLSQYGPIALSPDSVMNINDMGGSFLGSSRGKQSIEMIVDRLEKFKINMLFTIGGDGTLRGAKAITEEVSKRNLKISVIGIPKTIDNDISYVARSFGFETAFSIAVQSIQSARVEAVGAQNGIGLVKLMGRHSGFIAANAALAKKVANFILIPEIDFDLEGEKGLMKALKRRLEIKNNAVIVVAEGAGQKYFMDKTLKHDASGNIKLEDIGLYLKDKITQFFESIHVEINLKYIDPSYIIRSASANPNDTVFCGLLAQNAVHAAMVGKTNMTIGVWNNLFVHIPLHLVVSKRKQVNPEGKLWQSVLESTGQPSLIN